MCLVLDFLVSRVSGPGFSRVSGLGFCRVSGPGFSRVSGPGFSKVSRVSGPGGHDSQIKEAAAGGVNRQVGGI